MTRPYDTAIASVRQRFARTGKEPEDLRIWRRFRRNFSVSLLGAILSLAIKSGQTLILTNTLRVDDYGRVLIVINLFTFLNSFIGLRLNDVMFRFFQPLREQKNTRAIQGLLIFCVVVSVTISLLIICGTFAVSPWLAEGLYRNPGLATLFRIYGCTVLFSSLADVFGPILRIYDRFTALVVPQVLGTFAAGAMLITYATTANHYDLRVIVAMFAAGALVQTVPPFIQAFRLVRPYLSDLKVGLSAQALFPYRSELMRCLFNSNLSGYLKIAVSPGDVFLLGVFASPTQVALYGLAKQLIAPLALLQTNVQIALTPEVTSLIARRKFEQFKRLARNYMTSALIVGGFLTICAGLLGRVIVMRFSKPDYIAALPMFYILLVAAWALLLFAVFRPLALSMDLLKWDNLAQLASTILLFWLIIVGRLDAWTMALVQLVGALALRLVFNIPVWMRLHSAHARSGTPTLDFRADT